MASYLDLDGLKYFKQRQDNANAALFIPQGVKINGVALNKTDITITDDTKLSKSDAESVYLSKEAAAANYLGKTAKAASATTADSAKKLSAAVNINGVSFDGTKSITINAVDSTPRIASSEKGAAGGVCPLGSDGLISATYLPSYVDDVIEGYYSAGKFYADKAKTQTISGETGKIYVDITGASNEYDVYRWSGSAFILINNAVSTADKAIKDGDGNTISATYVKKVTGKGLSTNDYTTTEKNKLAGIEAGANKYTLPDASTTAKGGVKIGNNLTISSGVLSLTSGNVTSALGFTPASSADVPTITRVTDTEIDTLFTASA